MGDALLWNEIGNIYLKIGFPEDAIAAYSKAIEIDPDSGWPYYNLGNAYFQTGEFGHALFFFRKSLPLMEKPENQALVWNKIGSAYRALKDIDNAIQAYKKADDLDMGAAPAEPISGRQSGNLSTFREITRTNKNGPDTNRSISELQKRENNLLADQPEPKHPVVHEPIKSVDQSFSVSKVGDHPNTSRFVREVVPSPLSKDKSIIVIPNPDAANESLPKEVTSQQESKQVQNSYQGVRQDKIQDDKPKDLSNTSPGKDNLEEILAKINIYENITRVNPTSDRAWDTLGKLYKSLGRYKDAIGAYQKAIEIAPDREVYYYYLGLLYSVEQQHDDAVRAFLFVLRKNPDYVLAHSALAGVYHRMGLENKANHHIATALPKMNNESAYNRACFYAICGDAELAFEFLRLALMNKDTTIEWIKSDPDLDPIRTDQRFQDLISGKDQPAPEKNNENYFSSELEGKHNQLLPILNNSLAR